MDVLAVDALSLAEAGRLPKAVNVVLIGAMARRLGGEKESWLSAVEALCAPEVPGDEPESLRAGLERLSFIESIFPGKPG